MRNHMHHGIRVLVLQDVSPLLRNTVITDQEYMSAFPDDFLCLVQHPVFQNDGVIPLICMYINPHRSS